MSKYNLESAGTSTVLNLPHSCERFMRKILLIYKLAIENRYVIATKQRFSVLTEKYSRLITAGVRLK